MRFNEFAKLYRTDKLNIQLDRGVPLAAGRLPGGDRHGVIGKRHQQPTVQITTAVETLWRDDKAEAKPFALLSSPDGADQIAKSRVLEMISQPARPDRACRLALPPVCRSCAHLRGFSPLRGHPPAQIADELLGVNAIGQGATVGAEPRTAST